MSQNAILAFVVIPLIVSALGWGFALWVRRQRPEHPAE
jgi:hypothetical protein